MLEGHTRWGEPRAYNLLQQASSFATACPPQAVLQAGCRKQVARTDAIGHEAVQHILSCHFPKLPPTICHSRVVHQQLQHAWQKDTGRAWNGATADEQAQERVCSRFAAEPCSRGQKHTHANEHPPACWLGWLAGCDEGRGQPAHRLVPCRPATRARPAHIYVRRKRLDPRSPALYRLGGCNVQLSEVQAAASAGLQRPQLACSVRLACGGNHGVAPGQQLADQLRCGGVGTRGLGVGRLVTGSTFAVQSWQEAASTCPSLTPSPPPGQCRGWHP